jgi:hypothetical protein
MDPVQINLIGENITGKLVEYKDEYGGFWKLGRGVTIEHGKGGTFAVIEPVGSRKKRKRALKVPADRVKLYAG